jgi:GT2 family glycosyltransferase
MFSIVIPTWNNLPYVQLCVQSLRQHSTHAHQIILHVNDGSDGTRAWAEREGLEYTASQDNIGICFAVNRAGMLARGDYLIYMNDDMVAAPGWDQALLRGMERVKHHGLFMLSGTMVEPTESRNPCVVVSDFGRHPQSFQWDRFAREADGLKRSDWLGSTWPPTLVSRAVWHELGGYSTELTPGMSSDNDFSMKLWHAGCRVFLGVGDSLFYHFAQASTARVKKNDGRRQFLMKWGMTQSAFDRHFLRRGTPAGADLRLPEGEVPRLQVWKAAFKRRWG